MTTINEQKLERDEDSGLPAKPQRDPQGSPQQRDPQGSPQRTPAPQEPAPRRPEVEEEEDEEEE